LKSLLDSRSGSGRPGSTISPALAAFLSFLLPGLGQAASGDRRRGLIISIPALSLAAAVVVLIIFARKQLADGLVANSGLLLSIILVDILATIYHLWAIADAYLGAAKPPSRAAGSRGFPVRRTTYKLTVPILMAVMVCTVGVHLYFGYYVNSVRSGLDCLFSPGGQCGQIADLPDATRPPDPTLDPGDDTSSADPSAGQVGPQATPYAAWVSNANGVKVRQGPGTTYPINATVTAGTIVVGEVTTGASYTIGGTTSSNWLKITSGPLQGGYAAALYFDATMVTPTAAPSQTISPIVFPVSTMAPVTGVSKDWAADGYLNVLLVGADAGQGRSGLRTDTMILLQVKMATGQAAMYGIPRNLFNVPLPAPWQNAWDCHCFFGYYGSPASGGNYMLNALWLTAASWEKAKFPLPGYTDWERGFKVLEGTIGNMTGVHVDGAVYINLLGMVKLVDELGGLDIYVPSLLHDDKMPFPDKPGTYVLNIPAGQQHLDGAAALAYARSRHSSDDTQRMARQQAVIKAIRTQVNPCKLVQRLPDLMQALGGMMWTDLPREDALKIASLAQAIGGNNVQSFSFIPQNGYPEYVTPASVAAMRNAVAHGLDNAPKATPGSSTGGGGGGFSLNC
jgi:LCP family protein required for cell wall assembly